MAGSIGQLPMLSSMLGMAPAGVPNMLVQTHHPLHPPAPPATAPSAANPSTTASSSSAALTSTAAADPHDSRQQKYMKISSVEMARVHGVPVISPLHAPKTVFWLKQTAAPQSQLSDIARYHLYCDYMFLTGQVARDKLESKKRRRGVKKEKISGATKYHAKKLQELYQCSLKTIQRIIKIGKTSENLEAKKRPGRSRTITSADISAANVLQNQMGN